MGAGSGPVCSSSPLPTGSFTTRAHSADDFKRAINKSAVARREKEFDEAWSIAGNMQAGTTAVLPASSAPSGGRTSHDSWPSSRPLMRSDPSRRVSPPRDQLNSSGVLLLPRGTNHHHERGCRSAAAQPSNSSQETTAAAHHFHPEQASRSKVRKPEDEANRTKDGRFTTSRGVFRRFSGNRG